MIPNVTIFRINLRVNRNSEKSPDSVPFYFAFPIPFRSACFSQAHETQVRTYRARMERSLLEGIRVWSVVFNRLDTIVTLVTSAGRRSHMLK